jgi:(p)ppGpp synthase/HD superfamily hydrolase
MLDCTRGKEIMNDLEKAIVLALKKHAGQKDKMGKAYILHPLRVMTQMETEEEMTAAVLHDVIEDTPTTTKDLKKMGFSKRIVQAVEALSRQNGEKYEDYIDRVVANKLAVKVKIADLRDNTSASRLIMVTADDIARVARYKKALAKLKKVSREKIK